MRGEVAQEDGIGFAMRDEGATGDVRLFSVDPVRFRVRTADVRSRNARDEDNADGSAFDDEGLEERQEVERHLRYAVVHEESQRLLALALTFPNRTSFPSFT